MTDHVVVSEHAVERLKLRAGLDRLHKLYLRQIIATAYEKAVETGAFTDHYHPGQKRFPVDVAGKRAWGILGEPLEGFPLMVVTVLSTEQVDSVEGEIERRRVACQG